MAFSPLRDLAGVMAVLAVILVVPLALAALVYQVTSVTFTQEFAFQITSGDFTHLYFISLLGMSQLWYGTLSAQLGLASVLSPVFEAIASDWAALSIVAFLLAGGIAAFLLKSDLERMAVPVGVCVALMLAGLLFTEGFIRGIAELEEFTKIGLSNALSMLIVVSYGVGTVLCGLTSFGLGKLVFGRGPRTGAPSATMGESAQAKPAEVKEEPTEPAEKVIIPPTDTEAIEVGPQKSAEVAAVEEAAMASEAARALSASEMAVGKGLERASEQAKGEAEQIPEVEGIGVDVLKPMLEARPGEGLTPSEPRARGRSPSEVFAALEGPLNRIASKVEKEPGVVWRPIPCPVCGSELTWSREKHGYFCPVCGAVP